jgi:hypothetical protein
MLGNQVGGLVDGVSRETETGEMRRYGFMNQHL